MRRLAASASIGIALLSWAPSVCAETVAELFARVHRSVVVIRASEVDALAEEGQGRRVSSLGSGVLISTDGKVLTAAHLVHAASEISVEFWDGQRVSARVVSSARGADISLLVSHIISHSGGFEGLIFAVAANVARELVVERGAPWHGIDGLFLSDELVKILNLPGPGVLVRRVVPDSTGARLGLHGGFVKATIGERTVILGGDVILKAQGLSSVRSATSRFSRPFSCSSCRSRRASLTSRPPYLAFHR
jgi:S1-C subfamily serine protease